MPRPEFNWPRWRAGEHRCWPVWRAMAPRQRGFTLIELLVVMAIIGLLVTVAAPRYLRSVQQARETSLRSTLQVLREAIDLYASDRGRYPASLDELAAAQYLRGIPEDPVLGRKDAWVAVPAGPDQLLQGPMADVRSGAAGRSHDGTLYAEW